MSFSMIRRLRTHLAVFVLVLSLFPFSQPQTPAATAQSTALPQWEFVNAMISARSSFTATMLNNGKILVVGGSTLGGSPTAQSELYDPVLNIWSATGSMREERQQHTATLLPDGRVLIAGGVTDGSLENTKTTAEIYNPATGTFAPTGSLRLPRANHFAVLLPDGRVLVGGGYSVSGTLSSAELYNPASGRWTDASDIPWGSYLQSATLLNDGTVLVAGGEFSKSAAIYTPATNTWRLVEDMTYGSPNLAVFLRDGRVLTKSLLSPQAEIYNPVNQQWELTGDMRSERMSSDMSLLPNGQVLLSGGRTWWTGDIVDSTEIYDPATNEWTDGPRMNQTRENHVSIVLPNNYLLVIGGEQNGSRYNSVERLGPITGPLGCTSAGLVIQENGSCELSLSFKTVDPRLSTFQVSAVSSNQDLIPNSNLKSSGTGSAPRLTITPTKTNAITAPTRQGQAVITVTGSDGTRQETLPPFLVTVVPPPWLVMLYLNGDDGYCGGQSAPRFASIAPAVKRLLQRLREMEFNPAMRLVVLADVHDNCAPDGDSRIYVRDPEGLTDVTPKILGDSSGWPGFSRELNTADPVTVRSFVTWAHQTYPNATYSFLSLVDHGGGWAPDLNIDPTQPRGVRITQAGGWRGMSIDYTNGGLSMSTKDTHRALQGLGIDVVFFDACLMGMLESAYEIRNDADYLIAGQNQLFAEFPYQKYLGKENLMTATTPEKLSVNITMNYNSDIGGEQNPFVLASIDLRRLRSENPANLPQRVEKLAKLLLETLPKGNDPIPETHPVLQAIKRAYRDALKFDYDNSLTLDEREGYVDLRGFVQQLKISTTIPVTVTEAARDVFEAMTEAEGYTVVRLNPRDGTYLGIRMNFAQAGGISIYLPLGEQDYRPTRVDLNNPTCPALPERQLTYYTDPAQLAFTQDYPSWSKLLVRIEQNVPVRRAPLPNGCSAVQLADAPASIVVDTRPFTSPAPLQPAKQVYLPLSFR